MCWGLCAIDPTTLEPIDGQGHDFDPGGLAWQELDLLLVGNYEGPVTQLIYAAEQIADEKTILTEAVIAECAAWLSRIPPDEFASLDVYIKESMHSSLPGNEQRDYLGDIDTVKQFRTLIEIASRLNCKLLLWAAG